MAAGTITIDIAGVEGNMAAQPRRFAHSANAITIVNDTGQDNVAQNIIPIPPDNTNVLLTRGACLYIGGAGNVKVLLEGDAVPVTFEGVLAGTFMPILVQKIYGTDNGKGTTATKILAYY